MLDRYPGFHNGLMDPQAFYTSACYPNQCGGFRPGTSKEWKSLHAVATDRSPGTKVPRPLGVLFGREDTPVLLARNVYPTKLER
jgi:hypothetical protein